MSNPFFVNFSKSTTSEPSKRKVKKTLYVQKNEVTFRPSKIDCQKIAIPLEAIYPLMGESLFFMTINNDLGGGDTAVMYDGLLEAVLRETAERMAEKAAISFRTKRIAQ